MSTLLEIEAASEALPPEQKEELVRFLTARLRPMEKFTRGARLVEGQTAPCCWKLRQARRP